MCSETEHLSDQEQAEEIARHSCAVRDNFDDIYPNKMEIPKFTEEEVPQFTVQEVASNLKNINPRKAVPKGDIPPKNIKKFSQKLAVPLTDIINSSIKN